MMQVEIKITGLSDEMERLRRMNISLFNFEPEMKTIGRELTRYFANDSFATQGGNIGVRWPALAQSTIKTKLRHYASAVPMINTGRMQKSFKADTTPVSVTISNTAPYFKYHQSTAPRTKLPRRPMIGINEDVKTIVRTVIKTGLDARVEIL